MISMGKLNLVKMSTGDLLKFAFLMIKMNSNDNENDISVFVLKNSADSIFLICNWKNESIKMNDMKIMDP